MPAHDIYHHTVRHALEKDGWKITHDPYKISIENSRPDYQVDFGAEKNCLAAERADEKIAVEVKSFIATSFAYEFHKAVGQYLTYAVGVRLIEPERRLYLAISEAAYNEIQASEIQKTVIEEYKIKIIVFDIATEKLIKWKK